jgi:protein phosphatase
MKLEGTSFSNARAIRGAAETHTGLTRTNNEDYFGQDPDRGVFIVADGLGGHNAGEKASQLAVETLLEIYKEQEEHSHDGDLEAIEHAHLTIKELSTQYEHFKGMGTTLVMMRYNGKGMHLYSVGDSSIYLLREGTLIKLLREEATGMRGLLQSIIASEPNPSHLVSCALGPSRKLDIVTEFVDAQHGDVFLLCTDGLTNMMSELDIQIILSDGTSDLVACCQQLIAQANAAGGRDNITGMLVEVAHPDSME